MNSNVAVWESDPEIPNMGEEVSHEPSKGAIELCIIFGGGHEVDGDSIYGGVFGSIENESVLLPFLDKVVLWGKEDM